MNTQFMSQNGSFMKLYKGFIASCFGDFNPFEVKRYHVGMPAQHELCSGKLFFITHNATNVYQDLSIVN